MIASFCELKAEIDNLSAWGVIDQLGDLRQYLRRVFDMRFLLLLPLHSLAGERQAQVPQRLLQLCNVCWHLSLSSVVNPRYECAARRISLPFSSTQGK
jgi:hypothetical protein